MEHEFRGYALVLHDGVDPRTGGVAIAGFTTAGTPAIKFTAIFSSIPHIGKLKALICIATPCFGTIM